MSWHDSIKSQSPQHPDSDLIAKIRGGRVNVSKMSPAQLNHHLEQEAVLRAQLRQSQHLDPILPTSEEMNVEEQSGNGVNRSPKVTSDMTNVKPTK